jgi:prepilin-type processing-associated H-X9-DG protein
VACIGDTDHGDPKEELDKTRWGVFGINSGTRFANIRDGSSMTMLVSECIVDEPGVSFWDNDIPCYHNCLGLVLQPSCKPKGTEPRGFSWFFARRNQAWSYSVWVKPNDKRFSGAECELIPRQGPFAARSRHPGGVNVVLADGSVDFYSDTIDEDVWKARGTRAGDELAGQ